MASFDESLAIIIQNLPLEIAENLAGLILLMKTLGIIFIIYFIFLIIKGILTIKTAYRIKSIYNKINSIDVKIDKILNDKHKKENSKDSKKIDKKQPPKSILP